MEAVMLPTEPAACRLGTEGHMKDHGKSSGEIAEVYKNNQQACCYIKNSHKRNHNLGNL